MKYLKNRLDIVEIGEDMAIGSKMDNLLTVREVAKLLHVHPNTLRRWADKGVIGSLRITARGDRRFMYRDIEQFLKETKTQNKE